MIESLIKHQIPGVTARTLKLASEHGVSLMGLYQIILYSCAVDPNGLCGASNTELSKATRESIRTIGYQLKQLEMLEYIRVRRINQYVRQIETFETDRIKRLIDRQKGPKEPDWMDEYIDELAKVGQ